MLARPRAAAGAEQPDLLVALEDQSRKRVRTTSAARQALALVDALMIRPEHIARDITGLAYSHN